MPIGKRRIGSIGSIGSALFLVAVLRDDGGSFVLYRTVAASADAFGEALSPDGQMLAVTTRDGIDLLDVARLEQPAADPLITRLTDGGSGPIYDIISGDDRLLFVSEEDSRRIGVFSLPMARDPKYRRNASIGYIPTASAPVGLAVSPDGKWLYATSEVAPPAAGFPARCRQLAAPGRARPVGVLMKIDIAKAATDPRASLVAAIPASCGTVRVAVSPSGRTLWVTARGDDALLRIPADFGAGRGNVRTDSFHIGTEPVGVTVRPDDEQVWVALSARFKSDAAGGLAGIGNIGGIDGINDIGKIEVMSAPASGFPREINFLPDGRTLVVTLFRSRAVEFMPTP